MHGGGSRTSSEGGWEGGRGEQDYGVRGIKKKIVNEKVSSPRLILLVATKEVPGRFPRLAAAPFSI